MQVGSNVGAAFSHTPSTRNDVIRRWIGVEAGPIAAAILDKNITENTFKKPFGMISRFGSRIPKWAPNWQKLALDLRVSAPPGYDFGLPIRQINEEIAVIVAGLERLPKLTRMAERTQTPDQSRVRAFNRLMKAQLPSRAIANNR